ncbi:MAG: glutathionylspermidine synthase family protein [Planctomycetes bacterium]|nr:glutathionylspermidine synthase family protein [Planctomycetota bacterium]
MLRELHQDWVKALVAAGPATVQAELDQKARELSLCYGERPVCRVLRPYFLRRAVYEDLERRCRRLVPAIHAALARARADGELWSRLKFSDAEMTLIEAGRVGGASDLLGRLDAFLGDDGVPRFMEFNGESPGGLAFGDMLGLVFEQTAPFRKLGSKWDLSRVAVVPKAVEALRASWMAWRIRRGQGTSLAPRVAIVDLPGMPTRGEFEIFQAAFERAGMPARVIDDVDLKIEGRTLMAGDFAPDLVYRRLVTMDILEKRGGKHLLAEVAERNLAWVANGFEGFALCHKGLFALLSDPSLRPPDLDAEQERIIDESIPWTRLVEPGRKTSPPGGGPARDLAEIAREQREDLVMKPATGYGGQGILLGWRTDAEAWEAALGAPRTDCWVVQQRIPLSTSSWPVLVDGRLEEVELHFDVCPYRIGGRAEGLGIRLSGGEILNVAAGLGSAVPAFIVE